MRGDVLRIAVVLAGVAAALGSASKQEQLQPSFFTKARPVSTTGCENACDQVSACELSTFEACFKHCRDSGIEQQRDGPDRLNATARATCEDLSARMHPQNEAQPPLPTFADSPPPR